MGWGVARFSRQALTRLSFLRVVHRPKQLSSAQKRDLKEIFNMLDADGSGALDAEELEQAFKLLNIPTSKQKIDALLASGVGDTLNYQAFESLMTIRINEYTTQSSIWNKTSGGKSHSMPFHEVR